MPVTELAILRLNNAHLTSELRNNLNTAKLVMESYSGYPFYYFHSPDDPAIIYIIGTWPSVEFHKNKWIPSPENQNLLHLLEGQMTVDAMFHVDIDRTVTPIPTNRPVLGIYRYFLYTERRGEFTRAFEHARKGLEQYAGDGNVVGGWRIDKVPSWMEEFVLFTGWDNDEKRIDFVKTEADDEYRKIMGSVDQCELTHTELLDTSPTAHE